MIVPATVLFSTLPVGAVFSSQDVLYEKCGDTTVCRLVDGSINSSFNTNAGCVYYPNATLNLG